MKGEQGGEEPKAKPTQLSFWDSFIISSAEQAGATALLSKDIHTGQNIAGIKMVNPLLSFQPLNQLL